MNNSQKNSLQKFLLPIKKNENKSKDNDNKILRRKALVAFLNKYSIILHAVYACTICFFIEWISRHSFLSALEFMFDRQLVFLYNSLIVFTSLLLTYLFKRRILIRTLIGCIWMFLGVINGCILAKRVTPFSYTDLKLINDLFTMQSNYFTLKEEIIVIAGVVALVLFILLLWKKSPKFDGKPRRFTCLLSIGGFLLLIPMVTQAAVNSNILSGYFENLAQGYEDYGFIYSFSASVIDQGMTTPENYSEETINAIQASKSGQKTELTDEEKPNIICVLLESFVDPDQINFLQTSKDAVPNFRSLKEKYSSGSLTVPIIGAGTANTEFEVLTGMGLKYFGLGEYPYKTILKSTSSESIASNLSDLGYGTHVVHNNGGNFYSRKNAFTQMGFDTFTSKEMLNIKEYTPLGTWPTDDILIEAVKKSMDSTPEQSDFVYTITVQAHGSYPTKPVLPNPEINVSGAPTEASNNAWEYYVNQIHEVDKFIKNLTDMLNERNEKTVVVFFGDHLPTMDLIESDMASNSLFETNYVTWNNFGMEKKDQDLTSYELLAEITNQVDIHEGTMFTLHQDNGYKFSEEFDQQMELLQYDILYGNRYAYHGQDLYPASDLVMGVEDIVCSKLTPIGDKLTITGKNFTPWSKVFVNGKKVSTTFLSDTTLQVSTDALAEGKNTIMVNQMGSSDTVFRSSNEMTYMNIISKNLSE